MGVRFEIESHGDKLISRELTSIGHRGMDVSPAFEEIAGQFRRAETRRFQTKGNGTWPPLQASTVARKATSKDPVVRANRAKVLEATGRLKRSLTVKGDEDQVDIIQPHFMVFGSKLKVAEFHQRGTRRMVARKPLGFTEHAKRESMRTLQRYIVHGDLTGSLAQARSREVR